MQPPELLEVFILPLEKSNIDYLITGSVASIIYGEPRLTHDVDMLLFFSQSKISQLLSLFPDHSFYCPPKEVIALEMKRAQHAHFNLIHHKSGLKADCYPHTGDKLELWAFNNRERIKLSDALSIWLAPPEYVIVRKMQFYRDGGSQKHVKDIKSIMQSGNKSLNDTMMQNWVSTLKLESIWDEIQKEL